MKYRILDPDRIVSTLEKLGNRIGERFPAAGLHGVCEELTQLARASADRVRSLERPDPWLRGGSAAIIGLGGAMLIALALLADPRLEDADPRGASLRALVETIDAGLSVLIVMGGAVWFLVTLEARARRRLALGYLDELRSIIHVIDMHQLTKDPAAIANPAHATRHSPARLLAPYELTRYLDYCSELLSLAAKVAALYAQSARDPQVIAAASDLCHVTSDLNLKIWQKISLVQHDMARRESGAAAP